MAVKCVNRCHTPDSDETTLRISLDAKARVKWGEFDQGGKTRVKTFANDHDFGADSLVLL